MIFIGNIFLIKPAFYFLLFPKTGTTSLQLKNSDFKSAGVCTSLIIISDESSSGWF